MKYILIIFLFLNILFAKSTVVGIKTIFSEISYPCFAYFVKALDTNPQLLKDLFVVDFDTEEKLDPTKAYFVLNSKYKSSCSKYPIFAFGDENRATKFASHYDGSVRDFDFALFVAKKDFAFDNTIIDTRNKNNIMRGKKIFEIFCKKDINNCKRLKEKDFESLQQYFNNLNTIQDSLPLEHIEVPADGKCPVCGMFVAKYPKWASQILLQDGHSHYFDGVKDMMKFLIQPEIYTHNHHKNNFKAIFVSDYYTLEKIAAKDAFFVSGSNIYGPMGYEFIPFKNEIDANEFSKAHNGKKIYRFNEITKQTIMDLDK